MSIRLDNYLYHGIIGTVNQEDPNNVLEKLNKILNSGYILSSSEVKGKYVTFRDEEPGNYTFVAPHPNGNYLPICKNKNLPQSAYMYATKYSPIGIILNPALLKGATTVDCINHSDEIIIDGNISVREYGIGIYVNPLLINEDTIELLRFLINSHNYNFSIYNVIDGAEIEPIEKTSKMLK